MPRTRRVVLPEFPHHVVQRGHNRQVVFAEPADYRRYLETLEEFKDVFGVRVYAFCLMTNHVHLLLETTNKTPNHLTDQSSLANSSCKRERCISFRPWGWFFFREKKSL